MALAVVDQILKLHRAQLKGVIELKGVKSVKKLYDKARSEVEAKLSKLKAEGKDQSFTAHHLRQVLVQVRDGLKVFEKELHGTLKQNGKLSATLAQRHTIRAVKLLEQKFTGTIPVLQVEQAAVFRRVYDDVEPSLLNRYQASITNYGLPTIRRVRDYLAQSIIENETVDEAVDRIMDAENGVFARERWRAERIVRTEMSYAYGVTNQRTMESVAEDVPDLKKRLVATFDARTGDDSEELHGQTVPWDEPFLWEKRTKKGGVEIVEYMQPPNRPNDREVVIPWRDSWKTPSVLEEGEEGPGPVKAVVPVGLDEVL